MAACTRGRYTHELAGSDQSSVMTDAFGQPAQPAGAGDDEGEGACLGAGAGEGEGWPPPGFSDVPL
jgi:hypothetical protein